MAKKQPGAQLRHDPFGAGEPKWPTTMRSRLRDGRLVGTPGAGVWLYKRVPMSAVLDAKTLRQQLSASDPLLAAYEAVASITAIRGGNRRSMVKSNYRSVHTLMLNVPQFFDPPLDHPAARQLRQDYGDVAVENHVLLFGVRLRDQVIGKRGLSGVVDSVVETLHTGGTPLEDYDEDFERVDSALTRAGLISASAGDIRMANAWFNYGLASDPVIYPQMDSLTAFSRPATAKYVRDHLRDVPPEQWPPMDGYHQISMAAVQDIDLEYVPADAYQAMWGTQLLDAGAAAISIHGLVEPARITRKEVESQQKRYIEDINERVRNNKLDKDEQGQMLAELESINALYGTGRAPPTLVDASVVVAFGQAVQDMEDVLGPGSPVTLNPMTNRQPAALAETWPCSNIRANPHRLDLPTSVVAYSGLVSLSRVGDRPRNGAALVGFTEQNSQPAWFDPRAAYSESKPPLVLVAGASGAGKALDLRTKIPTPSGWTTMGRLEVGDEVLDRSGHPCRVTALSEVDRTPEMYRITLSDGQSIDADANHQWVVSNSTDRSRPRKPKHLAAQANRAQTLALAQSLRELASQEGDQALSVHELHSLVTKKLGTHRWSGGDAIRASLRMVDVPVARRRHPVRTTSVEAFTANMPVSIFNARDLLGATLAAWRGMDAAYAQKLAARGTMISTVRQHISTGQKVTGRGMATLLADAGIPTGGGVEQIAVSLRGSAQRAGLTGERVAPKRVEFCAHALLDAMEAYPPAMAGHQGPQGRIAAAERVLVSLGEHEETWPRELARRLIEEGVGYSSVRLLAATLRRYAKDAGLASRVEYRQVTAPSRLRNGRSGGPQDLYRVDQALSGLARRLEQMQADKGVTIGTKEQVMSTAEMLAEGLTATNYGCNFAIRISKAVELPEVDLPIDPYVLGAWLGDGSSNGGQFTAEVAGGDQDHLRSQIEAAGYTTTDYVNRYHFGVLGLQKRLEELGVRNNKHIPARYLRASKAQRLAVLQGLMDTDGTVTTHGNSSLDLSDRTLAEGAVELAWSLGIKVSVSWDQPAGYRDEDGNYVACKPRSRIRFTTAAPVFRLPRKLARLPNVDELRETTKWLYIESIEPIESAPARCITVDSPDATYMAAGFVTTHNSLLMLHLGDQIARAQTPTIIIDPKLGSDHATAVRNSGGQVVSLDDLLSADGVFDPLRFGASPDTAVDLAASMLQQVNPWGDHRANFEVPSAVAIAHGVDKGATCTGQALQIAMDHGVAPAQMVEPVLALARSSAQFRAMCGIDPSSDALRVADGITYIRVGQANLALPEPGATDVGLTQRISVNLVRLMVSGSAMALTGRNGVVMLDEAWVFFGSGNTELERLARVARSQTVTVMLFTQRVSDATVAGIDEHISSGFILPLKRTEAAAACQILGLEPTEERLRRLTAKATIGDNDRGDTQPNWDSMLALHRSGSREVIRGSVALYADIHDRVVPVEIRVPDSFLQKASTHYEDIAARAAAQRQGEQVA
ncbi:ATP-binding protein [Pseudactinotalea sp. Z1748]|uniref:ATP-binding protein n=1 Tax=Pseudactinotalea sp. Z1748 TaxID=3413027 RepID=UPI003C7A646B